MRNKHFYPVTIFLWAILLLLGGCSPFGAGTRHRSDSYVLNSLFSEETPPQPLADLSDIGVMVGPIRMALYLDRSDVVIRNSRNEVEIADFASWAGPLRENFSRVLAENLSLWLNTKKVAIFPGTKLRLFDYSIHMNVTRFDGRPGDKTHLRARWVITDRKRRTLYNDHTVLSLPTEDDSIASMVASQSRLLADFGREIAEAIKDLEAKKATEQ